MTPADLVETLEGRGVRLAERDGGRLSIRPVDRVRPEELEALRREKADVLALLRGRTLGIGWSHISTDHLNRVLELRIPGWDQSLIITPGCRVTRELRSRDPRPGQVWCMCEILDLILANVPPAAATKVTDSRPMFAQTIAGGLHDRAVRTGSSTVRDHGLPGSLGRRNQECENGYRVGGGTRGRRP
jgi:hypothetical protein